MVEGGEVDGGGGVRRDRRNKLEKGMLKIRGREIT
jgi:hypothetical protein